MDYSAPAFIPGNKEWFLSDLLWLITPPLTFTSLSVISVERVKKKNSTKVFYKKNLSPVWCVPSKPGLFHLLHHVFLYCESSDTHGSLLHTWSIENIQRCELSTPNAPSESEKTLQRDFPDRTVPIALLNAQLWYACVRFWLVSDWSIYDFERTLGTKNLICLVILGIFFTFPVHLF